MTSQLSVQNLILRRAIADDGEWAVPLLFSTGPALFSYIFASPPSQAQTILQQAFVRPQHAFSYEHTQVLEVDHTPAGILIGYSGGLKQQADEKVHFVMARILTLRKLPKILVNIADFSRIKQDVPLDAYYILGFSLLPVFQGIGLGKFLLEQADNEAYRLGCTSICADVAYTNFRAKQLLEQHGYQIFCSKTTERFNQMTRAGGIHRMVKPLDA